MGFFSRLRRRSKSLSRNTAKTYDHLRVHGQDQHPAANGHPNGVPPVPRPGRDLTRALPLPVVHRILAAVCPHTQDDSYDTSEESMTEDGCMLCDMRDLAHSALACRRWAGEARQLLYAHIRIDPVHYCELEEELAVKRKRRSFFDRNGDPIDAPQTRLNLLMRTLRQDQDLADLVLSLRVPYMTREANKASIARTVSVLPNLRYVDLPSGIFHDDQSCHALKQELMARCPDLRRMSYRHGSEPSFTQLPGAHRWSNLEVLELSGLQVEASVLRWALASFARLRSLTLEDLPLLDDAALAPSSALPPFPAVEQLTIRDIPSVTASGLAALFAPSASRKSLLALTLQSTGVSPAALARLLDALPRLRSLSVVQSVARSFPIDQVRPLASRSLQSLHFEITPASSASFGMLPVSASYYAYLVSSLTANTLPALHELYVRDAAFPETLLLAPPPRLFAGAASSQDAGPGPGPGVLAHPLNVYSKGIDELEWNFTPYEPPATRGRRDNTTRPVSFHDAHLSRTWGGDSRKSVLVGNGFGGFLAVPVDDGRPTSSSGGGGGGGGGGLHGLAAKRDFRQDLWR